MIVRVGKRGELVLSVTFRCPFCGLEVAASGEDATPAVAHVEPVCATFRERDPLAFITACNAWLRAETQ